MNRILLCLIILFNINNLYLNDLCCSKFNRSKISKNLRGPRGFRGCRGPMGPMGPQGPAGVCKCCSKEAKVVIKNCVQSDKDYQYRSKNDDCLKIVSGLFSYVLNQGSNIPNIVNTSNTFDVNYISTTDDNKLIFSIVFKKQLKYLPIVNVSSSNGVVNIFNSSVNGFFIKSSSLDPTTIYFISISLKNIDERNE
jgi:hypothetical protein